MPQILRCPHCSRNIQVADNAAGKQVRCPLCKKIFTAPSAIAGEPVVAAAGAGRSQTAGAAGAAVAARPSTSAPASTTTVPPEDLAPPSPTECPACKAPLLPGAIACMDCGYLLQAEAGVEPEGPPNLCTNPACGVANSPKDRVCQRCGSPLPTSPGTMLHGRYRIERQLAVGGFGAVYLAVDTKNSNRPVAVKDMICGDPQEFSIRLNFFRREAEILRSLEMISIVPRVYDFIQQGQSAHLVLEYIRGQDLLKILEANGNRPFPMAKVIAWGKSICDVLAHMHSQSPPLIHRDLKPDNIMLLEDQTSIKMIDFGTARDLGRTHKTRLAAKTRVFTEGYAPPEQIIGKPEPRSDLFALAGTLYHLATGKPPEGFYTAKELAAQLAEPNGPLPKDNRWFFDLLRINLAEDANDRYFSAREIKADLEKQHVTKEVLCPKCRTVNPVREPYCLKCAEPLTDPTPPCNHCGKSNRMGSRCCIHCGNRLR
ncbi:MAG: protein kinase [Planctomycetes bacterium]|nr:protein kinase [Planctomycetota bacterium]